MSEIQKLTNTIRNYSESVLCYGALATLKKIDHEAMRLEITLTDARAEIKKFNNLFKNGIDCFMSPCERHSGENTPPFDEFIKKYGYKCTPCLVEELAAAMAKLRKLEGKK